MPSNYDPDAGRLPSQGPGLLAAVRRHPLVVVASVLVAAALGVLATVLLPTNYVADASITVGDRNTATIYHTQPQQNVTALANNAAQIMRSQAVYDRASTLVQHRVAGSDVSGSVTITPGNGSPVVTIEATEGSAKLARDLANAVGQAYLDVTKAQALNRSSKAQAELDQYQSQVQSQLNALDPQIAAREAVFQKQALSIVSAADRARFVQSALQADARYQALENQVNNLQSSLNSVRTKISQTKVDAGLSVSGVDTLYQAGLPSSPASSNLKRNLALAIALGLLVGVALAWRRFDKRRVIDSDDISSTLGAPMLGHLKRSKELANPTQVVDLSPGRPLADDLRVLASSLMLHMRHSGLTRCVVSSARVGEGKTVIALNLAAAASSAGHDVLLIDGDVRNSALGDAYDRDDSDSLFDVMGGAAFGEQFAEMPPDHNPKLPVIPVEGGDRTQVERSRLIERADRADRPTRSAIVDAPAVSEDPVTLWLASGPAGLVVVVSAASTLPDLRTVRSRADLAGVRILGFIVNEYRPSRRGNAKKREQQQRYRRGERVAKPAEDAQSATVASH